MIRLIRAYLNTGIMDGGVVTERYQGTPQGGPLSPLLANVLLDEVDFAMAQTPRVWRELDEWLRHRLRAIQLRQWKATHDVAKQVAVNGRRWWRNSAKLLSSVLTIAWFDQLGLPKLS